MHVYTSIIYIFWIVYILDYNDTQQYTLYSHHTDCESVLQCTCDNHILILSTTGCKILIVLHLLIIMPSTLKSTWNCQCCGVQHTITLGCFRYRTCTSRGHCRSLFLFFFTLQWQYTDCIVQISCWDM